MAEIRQRGCLRFRCLDLSSVLCCVVCSTFDSSNHAYHPIFSVYVHVLSRLLNAFQPDLGLDNFTLDPFSCSCLRSLCPAVCGSGFAVLLLGTNTDRARRSRSKLPCFSPSRRLCLLFFTPPAARLDCLSSCRRRGYNDCAPPSSLGTLNDAPMDSPRRRDDDRILIRFWHDRATLCIDFE